MPHTRVCTNQRRSPYIATAASPCRACPAGPPSRPAAALLQGVAGAVAEGALKKVCCVYCTTGQASLGTGYIVDYLTAAPPAPSTRSPDWQAELRKLTTLKRENTAGKIDCMIRALNKMARLAQITREIDNILRFDFFYLRTTLNSW